MPHVFEVPGGKRSLPPKKSGRHRFIAIASYTLTDESARSMYVDDGNQVTLDQENLWDVSVGCVDCEEPFSTDMKKFCNAPAYEG